MESSSPCVPLYWIMVHVCLTKIFTDPDTVSYPNLDAQNLAENTSVITQRLQK